MPQEPCRTLRSTWKLGRALVAVAAVLLARSSAGDRGTHSFTRDPPGVEEALLQKLPFDTHRGNARVAVRFVEGEDVGAAVSIRTEDQVLTLHDDGRGEDEQAGDGVFSSLLRVDFDEFDRNQRRREDVALQSGGQTPVFVGHRLTEFAPVRTFTDLSADAVIDVNEAFTGLPAAVNVGSELFITDPSVVEDPERTFEPCGGGTPTGKWSFAHLMTEMANEPETGITPSEFAQHWLHTLEVGQIVNGFLIPPQPVFKLRIIDRWVAASGGPGQPLDLSKAPFRLLAIVNRVDMRANSLYGGSDAGEVRFIFGGVDLNRCQADSIQLVPFTVIFEYGIKRPGCAGVRAWAQQWHDLGGLPRGSVAYNAALEAITDTFTEAGADPSKLPNKSALNQLRTNFEVNEAKKWELREFRIRSAKGGGPDMGHLQPVTVKQSPDSGFNQGAVIADYVNANEATILDRVDLVPLVLPDGQLFRGGASFSIANSLQPGFWDGPSDPPGPNISNLEARHLFSLNTCNGCHTGETDTAFIHIRNRMPGEEALLSRFLTGADVNDPADGAPIRRFDDLARRAQDLDALANSLCISQLFQQVLNTP